MWWASHQVGVGRTREPAGPVPDRQEPALGGGHGAHRPARVERFGVRGYHPAHLGVAGETAGGLRRDGPGAFHLTGVSALPDQGFQVGQHGVMGWVPLDLGVSPVEVAAAEVGGAGARRLRCSPTASLRDRCYRWDVRSRNQRGRPLNVNAAPILWNNGPIVRALDKYLLSTALVPSWSWT